MKTMTRRQLLKLMSAAGLGSAFATRVVADEAGAKPVGAIKELTPFPVKEKKLYPAFIRDGKIIQPERPLPMVQETDVLVVGGGAAGFAAAVSAARAGARTTLVERYGYFGGLWTGGIVLIVLASHAKESTGLVQVLGGIGNELLERHKKFNNAIIYRGTEKFNPTTDPEATKFLMDEMVSEAGVKVLLHSWAVDAVMEGNTIRGVVFESKAGRQAILAKVVIDATGDGDIFAAAGAEHTQMLHAVGLVHRVGNADRTDRTKLKAAGIKTLGALEPLPSVKWVNLRGPSTDGLNINELTRLEMEHRKTIWNRIQKQRQTPGGEELFLLQVAPQIGVRTTRLLAGTKMLTNDEYRAGQKFPDVIAVGGAEGATHRAWPIPYGTMVPKKIDGLLTAGRSICVDNKIIEEMRLIATCLTTGHAAGAAAALAVESGCQPRNVDISKLQKLLTKQGAYLG